MLFEESVLDKSAFGIEVVQDRVREPLLARSKNGYLKVLVSERKTFSGKGPDREARVDEVLGVRIVDGDVHVWLEVFAHIVLNFVWLKGSFHVNKGFVKIKNQQFFVAWFCKSEIDPV